jgi:hypothetical protein
MAEICLLIVENDEQKRVDVGSTCEKLCLDVVDGAECSTHHMTLVATVATSGPYIDGWLRAGKWLSRLLIPGLSAGAVPAKYSF